MPSPDSQIVGLEQQPPPTRARIRPPLPLALAAGLLALAAFAYATRAPEPAMRWEPLGLPAGSLNLDTLVATDAGFAVASRPGRGGAAIWWTPDGSSWSRIGLSRAAVRLVPDGSELFAYDARSAMRISGSGEITSITLPDLLRTGYGSGRPGLVPGPRGLIAQTVGGDVYRAPEGGRFQFVVNAERWRTAIEISSASPCSPPARIGPDLPPVVSTRSMFFAFISDHASGVWPICEPIPWTSGDGSVWKPESLESPFGRGSWISDVGWRSGRFIAVGGVGFDEPTLWSSSDGMEWQREPAPPARGEYELIEVEAGPIGWVTVGRRSKGQGLLAWVSEEGECWEPLPVAGSIVAVGSGAILMAERADAAVWIGEPVERPMRTSCR